MFYLLLCFANELRVWSWKTVDCKQISSFFLLQRLPRSNRWMFERCDTDRLLKIHREFNYSCFHFRKILDHSDIFFYKKSPQVSWKILGSILNGGIHFVVRGPKYVSHVLCNPLTINCMSSLLATIELWLWIRVGPLGFYLYFPKYLKYPSFDQM